MAYTSKEFQNDTPPRIMGSETEYNVQYATESLDLRPFIGDHFREDGRDNGDELWLPNGSRFYIDSGSLVEYATPEVTSARDVVAYERAGEETMQRLIAGLESSELAPFPGTKGAYKRSGYCLPHHERQTAGHHENYLTAIPAFNGLIAHHAHPLHCALDAYLSTRGVWAGAGIATEPRFELTQKYTTISFNTASKTTHEGNKPAYIIHNSDGLNQLEIRLGDGNMSEWAIMQKYAFTSLVLRMIEHGVFPRRLQLPRREGEAEKALFNTSRMMTIRTQQNGYLHPATHQRLIAEAALEFAGEHDFIPTEEIIAAHEIIEVCHTLEEVDHRLEGIDEIADRVDWAAKLSFMRNDGYKIGNRNYQDIYNDLRWEDIAVSGIARQWYSERQPSIVSPEAVTLAGTVPPLTRAMARTAVLESLDNHPNNITWGRVEGFDNTGSIYYHRFEDPYEFSTRN